MKSTMLRLYTEDKNRPLLTELMGAQFEGYSVWYGEGRWKGTSEASCVFEIIVPRKEVRAAVLKLKTVAAAIKAQNGQESVLITRADLFSAFY